MRLTFSPRRFLHGLISLTIRPANGSPLCRATGTSFAGISPSGVNRKIGATTPGANVCCQILL